jgi:hypothetical protein
LIFKSETSSLQEKYIAMGVIIFAVDVSLLMVIWKRLSHFLNPTQAHTVQTDEFEVSEDNSNWVLKVKKPHERIEDLHRIKFEFVEYLPSPAIVQKFPALQPEKVKAKRSAAMDRKRASTAGNSIGVVQLSVNTASNL